MNAQESGAGLTLFSGGAMRRFLTEALPLFERAQGIKVSAHFALTRILKKEIEDGAAFDMALMPRSELDALAASGLIVPGSQTDIVRSIVGFIIRVGAPAPDISTVEAFKNVLRRAKSISHSQGPSGLYVAALLNRLGLGDEMREKTVLAIGRPVGEVVARGEAEIGMQQIIENQSVQGAHLVGPLPPELGNFVAYSAGFAAKVADHRAAQALVAFLKSPESERIIRQKGMEPA